MPDNLNKRDANPGKRLAYLDTARALSALSVVVWHFYTALFDFRSPGFIRDSPLHMFWYGDADVTFFFIHSGFILTYCNQQFTRNVTGASYTRFLISRGFRIYPLYIFVLVTSHLFANTFYPLGSGSYVNPHFREFWNFRKTWTDVLREALLVIRIPEGSTERYLPQDWTLSVELIVSFFLPFLSLLMKRKAWICCLLIVLLAKIPGLITYLLEFGAGIVLFHFMDRIKALWARLSTLFRWMVVGLALLLSTCLFHFSDYLGNWHLLFGITVDRLVVTSGCALWFAILLSSRKLQRLLSWPFFVKLGEVCYGIYLFHLLLLIIGADYGMQLLVAQTALPVWIDWLIVLGVMMTMTVSLSFLSYSVIERPLIRLGKRISAAVGDGIDRYIRTARPESPP